MKKTIIFSDIDGTFIDSSYNIVFSRTFLKETAYKFRIVFVSSRTAEEIIYILGILGWKEDFIAENGAVLGFKKLPYNFKSCYKVENFRDYSLVLTGSDAKDIIPEAENILKKLNANAVILNKLTAEQAAQLSGYDVESAKRSLSRRGTVLLSIGTEKDPLIVSSGFEKAGYHVTYGGKWFSVGNGLDKGAAVQYYLSSINFKLEDTAGIGNSDNDFSLLNAVSKKFIINDKGYNEKLNTIEDAVRLNSQGVKGWKVMISILSGIHEVR